VSSDRPLWLVVAALGLSVLALALRHEQGTIAGIGLESLAAVIAGVVLIFMVFGAVSALLYHRLGQTLRAGMFWLTLGGLVLAGYNYRYDIERTGQHVLASLAPGVPFSITGRHAVEIARAIRGKSSGLSQVF